MNIIFGMPLPTWKYGRGCSSIHSMFPSWTGWTTRQIVRSRLTWFCKARKTTRCDSWHPSKALPWVATSARSRHRIRKKGLSEVLECRRIDHPRTARSRYIIISQSNAVIVSSSYRIQMSRNADSVNVVETMRMKAKITNDLLVE